MNETEVIALMESSNSSEEWNANCDLVKAACNGYPPFWYQAIVMSGLMRRVTAKFGGSDQITITAIGNT